MRVKKLIKKSILFVISILITSNLLAQKTKKVDQIFEDWNQKNHPGGVVYISKADKVLYLKAFGLANIQYSIPNTTESVFNLASVSKQFTALGIALLQEDGKLSIEDSIQKYLPELPNFGHKITIRHLLHHTSGLRSTPEMFGLAGWRDGDAISTEDVFNYTCKQRNLNFMPGSEYMYSNTNYVLLSMIIARVTNQNFADWMKTNVFYQLGMSNTYIDESNLNVTAYTSSPYSEENNKQFVIAQNLNHDIGASNVYSSAPDLMKWMKQINNPEKKWLNAINLMLTIDTLTNGTSNEYALGLIRDDYKEKKRIYHNGGIPGYLSFTMNFPDEQLSVIVLTNYLDYQANQRVEMLLSLFLNEKSDKQDAAESIKPVPLNLKFATKYTSDYWNNKENYSRSVYLENDSLWYLRSNGTKSPMLQVNDSMFIIGGVKTPVHINFKKNDGVIYMHVKDGLKPVQIFEPYDNSPLASTDLNNYSGVYYSSELETSYTITTDQKGLTGYHSRHGYFSIKILRKGFVNWSGMAVAKYELDDKGKVIGFYVTMNRVRNVWFAKQ
jgi:CubicO group peptidase (beta-lactamase class C family)